MKILVIQEAGRHAANKEFRECLSLQRAFIYHGHFCDVWGLGHFNYNEVPDWNSYDLILNLENYDSIGWIPNLENFKSPLKLLWSIDAHYRGEHVFEQTFKSGGYDILLHSTRDFVKESHHLWFPNAFDDDLIYPKETTKKHFIGFCGNYANRKELLDWMSQNFGMKQDIFVIGDAMVTTINEYVIHFNKNILNDINYRSFETIGAGCLLLTNFHPDYEELGFRHKINCLFYHTQEDIKNILEEIKENPTLLQEISKMGLELSKSHTYKVRVGDLLNTIKKM